MMRQKTESPCFLLIGALILVGAFNAQAQIQVAPGDGIKVKGLEAIAQNTPDFEAGGVKDKKVPNPREWLEVEVEFDVDKVSPRDAVIPELLFRYYIALTDEGGRPVTLTGDVTHLNVEAGETYYSAVYVAPSTIQSITGDERVDTNKGFFGVEIYFNGVLVGGYSSYSRGKFWQGQAAQQGVLPREKTPFSLLWIDRYPETKQQ